MKKGTIYRCACGYETPKWLGRCPDCQAWGSFEERGAPARPAVTRVAAGAPSAPARPIAEVDVDYLPRSGRSKVTGTPLGAARAVFDMSKVLAQ